VVSPGAVTHDQETYDLMTDDVLAGRERARDVEGVPATIRDELNCCPLVVRVSRMVDLEPDRGRAWVPARDA
jgi:hypothetical protein